MLDSLTRGLDKQQQVDVTQNFKESLIFRKRLVEVIQKEIESNRIKTRDKSRFKDPNWANEQAYYMGRESALSYLIDFLTEKI